MSVEFLSRDEWRRRGRPRAAADPAVMELLRRTVETRSIARIPVPDTAPAEEVRHTLSQLRRAADELGWRLRVQPRRTRDIMAAGELRFYAEE